MHMCILGYFFVMAVVCNFQKKILWLMWEFLDLESECGGSVYWSNNKIIDNQRVSTENIGMNQWSGLFRKRLLLWTFISSNLGAHRFHSFISSRKILQSIHYAYMSFSPFLPLYLTVPSDFCWLCAICPRFLQYFWCKPSHLHPMWSESEPVAFITHTTRPPFSQ